MPDRRDRDAKEAAMQSAILDFHQGIVGSIRAAAATHGVHYSTLSRRLKGGKSRQRRFQKSALLTPEQEETLVSICIQLDDWGYPLKLPMVRGLVYHLQPSEDRRYPDAHWISRWVKRHPTVLSRLAARMDRQRATQDNPAVLTEFFFYVI